MQLCLYCVSLECAPRPWPPARLAFTQTESTMKRHAVTNTDTSVPEAEIIYRGLKTEHETEKPLGTETLQAG